MGPGPKTPVTDWFDWLRGLDLNQRPLGYEPNELPGCSTPHLQFSNTGYGGQIVDCAGHVFDPIHC